MPTFSATAKQDLRAAIERKRGYWHPFHQGLLDLSPAFLQAYLDFHHAPFESGNLDAKTCELIYIAADAAVNHLYTGGLEMHVKMAMDKGASVAEILETIQLTMLAAHSTHATGIPILIDELQRAGKLDEELTRPLTAEEEAAKRAYVSATGHWPEGAEYLLKISPAFARAFLAYGEIPHREGPLSPKMKEFICIAVFASPVAPQPEPLRMHIRRAIEVGATAGEISDILQLSSAIAIHTCVAAIPALVTASAAQR